MKVSLRSCLDSSDMLHLFGLHANALAPDLFSYSYGNELASCCCARAANSSSVPVGGRFWQM